MRTYIAAVLVAALAAAPAFGATDWPQFQHDSYNSGSTSDLGPANVGNLAQAWSTNLYNDPANNYGLKFRPGTSPVVSNGVLYAYALTDAVWDWNTNTLVTPPQARLVALNASDGSLKWLSASLHEEGDNGAGDYWSNNGASVDPASGDICVASWNTLYRISAANGSIVWQHTNPGMYGSNAVVNGAPAIGNGKAYWMSQSGGSLTGVNLNAGTGGATVAASLNVAMPTEAGGNSYGTPVLFNSGGTAYAAMSWGHGYGAPMGGGIQVVNANTGAIQWSITQAAPPANCTTSPAAYSFTGSTTYANGVLYVRSYDDQGGHTFNSTLSAILATSGTVIWQSTDLGGGPSGFNNAVDGQGAPIVVGDKIFISGGTSYGAGTKVMAYSATSGQRLWQVSDIGGYCDQIAYANGRLFVGTENSDKLTVLNPSDGSVLGTYAGAGASPIVVGGVVYTVDANGRMVALATPGDANMDGKVDMSDYVTWFNNFGTSSGATWAQADFNGDGKVDMADYTKWFDMFGQSGANNGVPEPATIAICAIGGLMMIRRRR